MAAAYPMSVPSWINPPDIVGAGARGFELGLRTGQQAAQAYAAEEDRLAREQERAAEYALRQSQQQADFNLRAMAQQRENELAARNFLARESLRREMGALGPEASSQDYVRLMLRYPEIIRPGQAAMATSLDTGSETSDMTPQIIPGPLGTQLIVGKKGHVDVLKTPTTPEEALNKLEQTSKAGVLARKVIQANKNLLDTMNYRAGDTNAINEAKSVSNEANKEYEDFFSGKNVVPQSVAPTAKPLATPTPNPPVWGLPNPTLPEPAPAPVEETPKAKASKRIRYDNEGNLIQ